MNRRAVISGAGGAAHLHAIAWRANGVDVAAVFDPDGTRASVLAGMYGADAVDDFDALTEVDAEFVSIAGPPPSHVDQALAAVRPGRVVLVEKPVATSIADLERLAGAAGVIPVVQWRSGRGLRALQAAVAGGSFGPAPTVLVDQAWGRGPEYFAARAGWNVPPLLSVGIHGLDAIGFVLDRPIERLHRSGDCLLASYTGSAAAVLRCCLDGGSNRTRIAVCGEGRTGSIEGGDSDPTAADPRWEGEGADELTALTEATCAPTAAPLLIPFVADVLSGARPDADAAHRALLA